LYWAAKVFALALSFLSPRATGALATAIAWFLFDVCRFRRFLVLSNIATAFPKMPKSERIKLGRVSFANFILTAFEFLRSIRHDICADVELLGADHLHNALSQQHGAYVICCHLGNWEAMGAKMTRAIAPSHVLVKKVGGAGLDRFVTELRRRNGFLPVIRKEKGDGLKAIVKALSRHEVVGFAMDQARPGEPKLPFFGKPAKTNTSLAAIWMRHPAPIVSAFVRRLGVGRHVVEIMPALELKVSGNAEQDILALSEQFNGVVEAMIRANPSQYFWLHNRWK
jgi:KDO2-lipid IV(A) lauroyltransferase